MAFSGIPESGLAFLAGLREHNDKEWFEANRAAWDDQLLPSLAELCGALHARLQEALPGLVLQPRVGGNLFRLNRDVRFSKDKKPFETHAALFLWDGPDKFSAPGFFVRVGPSEVVFGGGLEVFEEAQLDRYRKRLLAPAHAERLTDALAAAKKGGLHPAGEQLPKPPRGFTQEHPMAEHARYKGLCAQATRRGGEWVRSGALLDKAAEAAEAYAPLHRWLCELRGG
jgi:uncharacterized protein (TIGR02453 family)